MEQTVDRLVRRYRRAEDNRQDDGEPREVFDTAEPVGKATAGRAARQPERNAEWDRGRGIAEVVDGVRQQGDAACDQDDRQLQSGVTAVVRGPSQRAAILLLQLVHADRERDKEET